MPSTEKLTQAAKTHSLTFKADRPESSNIVARKDNGNAVFSAAIVDGRFVSGYVIDRLGHVESHTTVKGMLDAIERRFAPTH